jgi:hypothetical protein
MKLDKYAEERLMELNFELFPVEGEDVTLLIGKLLNDHKNIKTIKEMMRNL